ADIIVGFEPAEALRWVTHLKPGGVAMVNVNRLVPPVVSLGLFDYPDDPIAEMRKAGTEVFDFDAGAIARELGDLRMVNTIMMGAIADRLPFPAETLKEIIVERFRAKKEELAELNAKAFEAGRQATASVGNTQKSTETAA
ncbi:MAG: 2-oxoacid:acceptor oxidoreductase family protein, partial [Rhodospirillales bacterium]|nr:2-oxoacid:acceptor oxidoreductase family protein [Rhodospirillales bacterium]